MSYFRNQLEDWLKKIDVKADRVLDVGGGSKPIEGRTKSWEVKDYRIIDNGLEEQKVGSMYMFDLNKEGMELTLMQNLGGEKEEEKLTLDLYDMVFCIEVFDYIWNPVQALENINAVMVDGGILYLSVPFIYPHHNPAEYDYLRYTRWGVEKLLKETGFEILELVPRNANKPSMLFDFWHAEGMHPCKIKPDMNLGHDEIGYCIKAKKI